MPFDAQPAKVGDEVVIKSAAHDETAEGEFVYEFDPVTYAGPWQLLPGTQLKIVSLPDCSN